MAHPDPHPHRPLPAMRRRCRPLTRLPFLLGWVLLSACVAPGPVVVAEEAPQTAAPPLAAALPEGASGLSSKPGWHFRRQAVASAHPLAAEAGAQMLRAGGNAVDAAIATQLMLNVVEPQSSGLGGGALLMLWTGSAVEAWDGRETAPAGADERLFLRADGQPMGHLDAVVGGRAVGVPGALRMLEAVHRRHGHLPWPRLFRPALAAAESGVPVGARLHQLLKDDAALRMDPLARAHFYRADGQPHPVGHVLRNPALAAVLRDLSREGSAALHRGPMAVDVVSRVRSHTGNPGRMSLSDMAGYRAVQRAPMCTDWGTLWRVCGFPPPSSGHITLMQILGIQARARTGAHSDGVAKHHSYIEASRLAFADRAQYIADPDFVAAPGVGWDSLLAPAYLAQRAALIGSTRLAEVQAGDPGAVKSGWAPMAPQPAQGTSHLSVVDAQGMAVALTTSIEAVFGARLMSDGGTGLPGGFLLNNQLTDFSFAPADDQGRPVANRVQAGKRPRSSMAPTLVFHRPTGELRLVLGSALGPIIIHAVARALRAVDSGGLDLQRAFDAPLVAHVGGPVLLEAGRFEATTQAALRARGHSLREVALPTGLHGLQRTPQGWLGAADPRREGEARGD
jgi:gamma-glutamyltranspeptidase / glutathione hydrolase